jgi:hypothetical protein
MGVERSVTRWYGQQQLILREIASLEERLRHLEQAGQNASQQGGQNGQATLQQQLAVAQEKLRDMGECPRPMMG